MAIELDSFIDQLRGRAQSDPDALAFVFLADGERETGSVTYGQLDRRSRSIAAHLKNHAAQGSRVLILIPAGLDFVATFLGCLYARIIAVPAYPPLRKRRDPRIELLVEDAGASLALTTAETLGEIQRGAGDSLPLQKLTLLAVNTL